MESDAQPRATRAGQAALLLVGAAGLLLVGRAMVARPAGEPVVLGTPAPAPHVLVHVAGEVVLPGVYRLPPGARWSDAIRAARGPTFRADLDAVNLAQPVRDGERVYVPSRPDPAPPAAEAGAARRGGPQDPAGGGTPVSLNQATAAQLEALPGIGPVLAARIIEHRRTRGPFQTLEDLLEVPGVGPRLLARLRPHLRVP
ncbi:MAG: ComEA family DNA-binding protein [Armatimonadota bacterium]|nr:ComEA family DNA-binding protein [Armatimonadota bacterium]MDR7447835.1 ComEA family DNA-binding protein [Armatimonadota bacterium]MDR7459852.1 ComEA family DNA-binding protein [Armatimonadota bacterium]MDR7479816.1 ComEA family DNA-binding protein [Armatimonadota bacterium]MDR7487521.1 ComEA family DNA-binding protein [Armatimonadota bacterium]